MFLGARNLTSQQKDVVFSPAVKGEKYPLGISGIRMVFLMVLFGNEWFSEFEDRTFV